MNSWAYEGPDSGLSAGRWASRRKGQLQAVVRLPACTLPHYTWRQSGQSVQVQGIVARRSCEGIIVLLHGTEAWQACVSERHLLGEPARPWRYGVFGFFLCSVCIIIAFFLVVCLDYFCISFGLFWHFFWIVLVFLLDLFGISFGLNWYFFWIKLVMLLMKGGMGFRWYIRKDRNVRSNKRS